MQMLLESKHKMTHAKMECKTKLLKKRRQWMNSHNKDWQLALQTMCRNPTLSKCGGEAQHFQSWGFGVLRHSRMFRVQQQGPKHLALRCSWCHWKGLEA